MKSKIALYMIYLGRSPLLYSPDDLSDVMGYQPTTALVFTDRGEAADALKAIPALYDMDDKKAETLSIQEV